MWRPAGVAKLAGGQGGVYGSGNFTMSGGTVSGNAASTSGGGVYVASGTFTMNDGTISGNTASGSGTFNGGGGVFVGNNGSFAMSSGTISNNSAAQGGGGVSIINGGNFTKAGGSIDGDTDNIHTANSPTNTVTNTANGGKTNGHAVKLVKNGVIYYRDSPLGTGQDISSSDTSIPPWNQ
jgi:hypothetical protein